MFRDAQFIKVVGLFGLMVIFSTPQLVKAEEDSTFMDDVKMFFHGNEKSAFYDTDPKVTFEVGTEASYIKYEEPGFMKQDGIMYGVFGKAALRTDDNAHIQRWSDLVTQWPSVNMFSVDGKLSVGEVDYTSNGTGSIDNIQDFMAEVRFLAGSDLPIMKNTVLTPYAGIGYRYLNDDSGGKVSTTGHYGYEREANYIYLPVGIDSQTKLNNGWSIGLNAEYDIFIDGQQKSHLEDVDASLSTADNDQNDGYGVRGSIRLAKEVENFSIFVEPFIRYWNIDSSDIDIITCGGTPCAAGYEPENNSTEYGLKLGARF